MPSRSPSRLFRPCLQSLESRDVPAPLPYGGIVSGSVAAGLTAEYTFTAQDGDTITLAMTSTATQNGFTAVANVFAPSGANIDNFTATGQRYLTVDESGEFTVQIHDNDFNQAGAFSLGLEGIHPISPNPVALIPGGIVAGTIDAVIDVKQFTFNGRTGDLISLALTSTAIDGGFTAVANVFAPSGANIDNFTATGQRYLTLEENGVYVVQMHDNDYAQRGSYTIGLEGIVPRSPGSRPLTHGGIVGGTIDAAIDVKHFTFTGEQGDVISLALTSTATESGFVAVANVYAPSGANIDNFTATGQRYITLEENGTYLVQLHDNDYAQRGAYTIGLESINPISPNPTPLAFGGIVGGTIDAPIDVKQFTFTAQAGDVITLALTSTATQGGFTAVANVYAPSGTNIDNFTATGQRYLTLEEDGVYMVQLHDNDYAQRGSYTIGLEAITPFLRLTPPLVRGGLVKGPIDAPIDVKQYYFAGKPGDVINLSLSSTAVQSGFTAVVNVFAPSGTNIDNFTATGQRRLTLNEDGLYLVQVHDNDYAQKGAYTIGLQTVTSTVPASRPLVRGGFVTGTIDRVQDVKHFTFTAKAGDLVALSLAGSTQPGFSAYARVFAPSGSNVLNFLAGNGLRYLTVTETGTFILQVMDNDFTQAGSFRLGLEGIKPPTPGTPTLVTNQTRSGSITQSNDVVAYLFSARAGARVTITLTSRATQTGFAATGMIFNSAGTRLLTFAAGVRTFVAPATGVYLLLISDNDFAQIGTFTVKVV